MNIFPTDADKAVFLNILKEAQREYNFQIYAYSLMINHYHFIYKDVGKMMSKIIGIVQEKYAIYFNMKYNHEGAVFMKPFQYKIIISKGHFFTSICYTLNNPVKAGITEIHSDYKWNSPLVGYEKRNLTDYLFVLHYYKPVLGLSLDKYIKKRSRSRRISDMEVRSMSDEEAKEKFSSIMMEITERSLISFSELKKKTQKEIISEARYWGISARQIADITGVSQNIIRLIVPNKPYI